MPAHKSPAWNAEDLATLRDFYTTGGAIAALKALPHRSLHSIRMKAARLKLRSPISKPARKHLLQGADLARAIELRERGWSFARIGAEFGVCETAASNAVHNAMCTARGHRPAERDASGKLVPAEVERLRYMLKKGVRGVEIQRRMAISAASVAQYRRAYNAELLANGKAPLPPPGNGERYCGVRLTAADRKKVEALLLTGLGSIKVAEQAGISKTSVVRLRGILVRRLKAKGQTLPGCDINGRRCRLVGQANSIPEETKQKFFTMLRNRMPVARAAKLCGIGECSGYRLRDELRITMVEAGEELPPPRRSGRLTESARRIRASEQMPREHRQRLRRLVHEMGEDAGRRELTRQLREERAAPMSFEDQLARVAAGAAVVPKFIPTKSAPDITLGGVATGAL